MMANRLLVLLGLLSACSDATGPVATLTPCSGYCEGLGLTIDSVRIVLPSRSGTPQTTVFSGDSVLIIAHVTNRGTAVPDSNTWLRAYSLNNAYGSTRTGPMAPGESKRFEVSVSLPRFSYYIQTRDSLHVELIREGSEVPHGYEFLAEKLTPAFSFTPTTMELRAVPAVMRYPSTTLAEWVVTNPSPYAIPADTLELCILDIDWCAMPGVEPVYMPAVAAGQTLVLPLPIKLSRTRFDWADWESSEGWNFTVHVCYDGEDFVCRNESVLLLPDYEAFCAVRRLQHGSPLQASTANRCKAEGSFQELDVLSFEAEAGKELLIRFEGTVNQLLRITSPDGELQLPAITTSGSKPNSIRFVPAASSRYYLLVFGGAGSYTVKVDAAG